MVLPGIKGLEGSVYITFSLCLCDDYWRVALNRGNTVFTKVNLPKSQVHFKQPHGHFVKKRQTLFIDILEASKIFECVPFVNRLKI